MYVTKAIKFNPQPGSKKTQAHDPCMYIYKHIQIYVSDFMTRLLCCLENLNTTSIRAEYDCQKALVSPSELSLNS